MRYAPSLEMLATERRIVVLATVSASLYGANYLVQRALSPIHAGPHLRVAALAYAGVTMGLFAAYAAVTALGWSGALEPRRTRRLALACPVAIALVLGVGRPYLSIDVFAYIAQGHQTLDGTNPYVHSLREAATTAYGLELQRAGWLPVHGRSPYGPLWTYVEAGAVAAGPTLRAQVLILKTCSTLLMLACAWLIWRIALVVCPTRGAAATAVFLWNPAVIAELAGEGHNDGAMIACVLASILLFVKRREGASMFALGVGALVKIVAPLVAPIELALAWRNGVLTRIAPRLALGIAAAAALAVASYSPLWIGPATLAGLREHSQPSVLASTQGLLYWILTRTHSEEMSARVLTISADAAFLLCAAAIMTTVRDGRSMVRGCGWLAVAYLVLAPGYWPWYVCLPVALLALAPSPLSLTAIFALSLASRAAAPIDALRLNGWMTWTEEVAAATIVGVWLPAAAIAIAAALRLRATKSEAPAPGAFEQPRAGLERLVD